MMDRRRIFWMAYVAGFVVAGSRHDSCLPSDNAAYAGAPAGKLGCFAIDGSTGKDSFIGGLQRQSAPVERVGHHVV